jgi:hypothetical protein
MLTTISIKFQIIDAKHACSAQWGQTYFEVAFELFIHFHKIFIFHKKLRFKLRKSLFVKKKSTDKPLDKDVNILLLCISTNHKTAM